MTSNYNQCKEEVKFIIVDLAINLQKLSMNRENTELNLIDITYKEINSLESILNLTKKSIQQYKSLFTPKNGAFQREE